MDYKALFDQSPFGTIITGEGGDIVYVNPSFCHSLRYTEVELKKIRYSDILHTKYHDSYRDLNQKLVSGVVPSIEILKEYIPKEGDAVRLFYKAWPVKIKETGATHCIGQVSPVYASNTDTIYLKSLLENVQDVMYFKDAQSKLLVVSDSYHRVHNPTHENLIGKSDFDLFTQEHAQQAYDDEQLIIKTGKPLINIEEKETKEGNRIAWVSTSKFLLRKDSGEVLGTFGISRDITEEKLHAAEIKKKDNILNAITTKMPIVVFSYTKTDGVTPLFGDPELVDAFQKSKIVKLSMAEGLPHIIEKITSQKDNQGYFNFPSTNTRSENEWYFENYVFESGSENPDEYIGIALDITERKQNEQHLKKNAKNMEKINKELNQFAYIVSHDLKAPLRAITNLAEWIEEDLPETGNSETRDNLKLMRSRVHRMENLINGILVYSRVSRVVISYEDINLNTFLREIIDSLSIPKKFEVILPETLPVISYPKVNFEQVLTNLVSNAIKYHTKPTGRIEIKYRESHDFHEFSVSDDGPGIAKEYHEKIFQIFQTLQARDTFESTGIGLTIVKKIVEERGGAISVDSEPGRGSTFIFTIPKVKYQH